ncbi:aminotransferase [Agaricicola taiwanensis]|uniref:Aminotransferase n=1 Tax=Agaricicola taiwanensis TaxID=591372 RepID=A0A8J2YF60_9RHOB|nr:pyridoxal phosphate-dependent aminotransferase [Agaricicola taiwanensis]GGE27986.1 aminotransferase [Agaricicola taiwanensis]
MVRIAERLKRLQPAATRMASERAADLRRQGRDIISLSTGEPDFVSPPSVMEAAKAAIEAGKTFYTPAAGLNELRAEVAKYYKDRFDLDYAATEVIVGSGAKPLIFEACAALLDPGDEAILIAPAFVSYVEQIRLCDATPVVVETDPETLDFSLDDIRAAITPRTRVLILNTPNNPSGRIFSDELVTGLCQLAIEFDFTIINDEIYERIIFDGLVYRNPLNLCPQARDRMLHINGASKALAMTGWRIGFAIGPQDLIKRMTMLQGHNTSGASSIAQWAALGGLRNGQAEIDQMRDRYQIRKDLITRRLSEMPHIRYIPPQGAFYIFADIRQTYGKKVGGMTITDDNSFCEALLEQAEIAVIPGSSFLQPGFFRMSFATSEEIINTAMNRMHAFLSQLR